MLQHYALLNNFVPSPNHHKCLGELYTFITQESGAGVVLIFINFKATKNLVGENLLLIFDYGLFS